MDFAELAALASGHAEARAIQTALKLGIFDILDSAALDDAALATAIAANRRATALIANAMVALGLLDKRANRYSLTEVSRRYLLRSSAEYLGGLILFDEAIFETWAHLDQAIRSGAPARPADMFQSQPEETERFIRAMDSLTRARGDPAYVANRLDLSRVSTFADIGGGPGTYAVAMLHRWPHLRAKIYDLPATLEVARRILAEREPAMLERLDLVRVDYLYDEFPGRCGALFMSNIIHSEDRARCRRGEVGIHDVILDDHHAAWLDRAKAFAEQLGVGRFIFTVNYIRHEQCSASAREVVVQVVDAHQVEALQHRGFAFGENSAGDFERGRQVVDFCAEMRPSVEHRDGVGAGAAADVGERRDAAEVEPVGDVSRIAAGAREAVHRANESLGLLGLALEHVSRARGRTAANGLIEMRPGFEDRFVEQDQAAQIFGGRTEQVAPRYLRQ